MEKFVPILLIIIGIALWRIPGRASFERRNEYGVEMFNSYGHMRSRRGFEGLLKFVGVIMILAGIGHLIMPTSHVPSKHVAADRHGD